MLSIIIPVYNEEDNIEKIYNELCQVLTEIKVETEFMFVNDGSTDKSMEVIKKLTSKDGKVRYIDFSRNFGHQIAVSAGLDFVKGDKVVIIDADGQDPPEVLIELYNKSNEGYEVVYAKRRSREGETWFKTKTAKWFYRILNKITSIEIPLDTGDFRIIDRKIVDQLKQMPERHKFIRGQVAWIGFNQTYVEYDRKERNTGETGYGVGKMLKFAIDGITSFSNWPLKVATISGFLFSIIGFLLILYTLYARFILKEFEPGWASQMVTIVFIGGIQLIGVGIIGEYIGRINENIQNRPLYIVKESNVKLG